MFKTLKKKQIFYLLNLTVSMIVFLCAYSFMDAVSRYIMNGFDEISSKLIIISDKAAPNNTINAPQNSLNWDTYEKLTQYLGDQFYVSPIIRDYQFVKKLDGESRFVSIWKVNYDFSDTVGLNIVEGRYFSEFEYSSYERKCLLSEKLKTDFISFYQLGDINTSIYNELCTFIGTASSSEVIPTASMSENIYIPINISTNMNPRSDTKITQIFIRNKNTNANAYDIEKINEAISIINKTDNYTIWHAEEFWQLQQKVASNLSLLVLAIAIVIIGLAGLSLANNLSLDVIERTGEIGLRIALGATKKNIFKMFFIEGITVVILGGILGIILGAGLITLLIAPMVEHSGQLGNIPMNVNSTAIIISFLVLMITALLASYLPANKALKIDASNAIRDI